MSDRPGLTNAGLIRGMLPNVAGDEESILYSDPEKGGDGSYHVSGDKEMSQLRWRVGQQNQGGVNSTLASSGAKADVIIDFGAQEVTGDSEVAYFFGRETTGNNRFAVRPQVGTRARAYFMSNTPISSELVFGTASLPGYLPSPLFIPVNEDISFNPQSLGAIPETIQVGAFCRTWRGARRKDDGLREFLESPYLPMWIGPEDKLNPNTLSGPEVSIAAGATVKLRFPAPYDADFVAGWILDDSTSTSGLEPLMNAILQEEDSREQLIDHPKGIDWRNFIACPTVTVTGAPNGGVIRAMSLKGPRGGWTHRIPRTSSLEVILTSTDSGTITFRGCLLGWAVKVRDMKNARRG